MRIRIDSRERAAAGHPRRSVSRGPASTIMGAAAVAPPEPGAACSCGGGCPRCQEAVSTQPRPSETGGAGRLLLARRYPPTVHRHLGVAAEADSFEHEADRIADEVLRRSEPRDEAGRARTPPLVEQITPLVQRGTDTAGPGPQMPRVDALGDGEPLESSARAFFEPRLGADLGGVRIHRSGLAAAAARHVQARAFALGRDLVFDRQHFQPATTAGRRLLAHELVHSLQQAAGGAEARTIQRSAIAHFITAGFDERAAVRREAFEENELPPNSSFVRLFKIRERKTAKFNERLALLDPSAYGQTRQELRTKFGNEPRKLARRLAALDKRRKRAAKKIGQLPDFARILEISVTYHYVESQTLPSGEVYRFTPSMLNGVKAKFRSGRVWTGLKWNSQKIGVRFNIQFAKATSMSDVRKVLGNTPGHARMVGEQLIPPQARVLDYDYTQNPPQVPPNTGDVAAQAYHAQIAIDTEAIRREKTRLKYYRRESDRAKGKPPIQETRTPRGEELDQYIASVIAHEIGHNIGMIHDDKGIMADQITNVIQTSEHVPDTTSSGVTEDIIHAIRLRYPDNPVYEENIQRLVDRIPAMTQKGAGYWQDQLDTKSFSEDPSPDEGITTLQTPGHP